MCRRGHRKHLRPKLTGKIKVRNGIILFNKQATRWLGVWMDEHQMVKKHHNRWRKNTRAAEARLRSLRKIYGIVPESLRAVRVA